MQLHRRDDGFPFNCFSILGEKFYDNFAKSAEKFSSFLEEYKTITNFFFIPVSIEEEFAVNTTSKYANNFKLLLFFKTRQLRLHSSEMSFIAT